MITINLKPEIEAQIREKAKAQNLSVEKYIERLIEKEIIDVRDNRQSELSIDRWENQLLKFINSPLNSRLSPLPDEAISLVEKIFIQGKMKTYDLPVRYKYSASLS